MSVKDMVETRLGGMWIISVGILLVLLLITITPIFGSTGDATRVESSESAERSRPKIALVLSGGAARGLAHIGVISVLEEYSIPIDMIVGVSMGSIVGGYFAYGYSIDDMLSKAREFSLKSIVDFSGTQIGWLSGIKEEAIFRNDLNNTNIEDLEIPLAILCTDIDTGELFIFDEGSLPLAMRASSAVPGVFDPVIYKGHTLVDGGVLDNVPMDIAKKMGANIVIASDVSIWGNISKNSLVQRTYQFCVDFVKENKERFFIDHIVTNHSTLAILYNTLLLIEKSQKLGINQEISSCDILIQPVRWEIKPFAFYKVDESYNLGREATLNVVPDILDAIDQFCSSNNGLK